MKYLFKFRLFTTAVLLILFVYSAQGQIRIPIKKKTTEKTNQEIDKSIDNGLDKLFGKKGKKKNKGSSTVEDKKTTANTGVNESTSEGSSDPEMKWSKYDFIPGSVVLFEDDLSDEENGEFPSRWDLIKGRVETVEFDGKNSICFFSAGSMIIPYIKNRDKDYLPEAFTLEFDAWFEKNEYSEYVIRFWDVKNQQSLNMEPVFISGNAVRYESFNDLYPGKDYSWNNNSSFWRHIAIAFNKRSLKVYIDDSRIINVPNIEVNPTGITINCDDFRTAGVKGINRIVTNVRIAEGGPKLYDKFLTDGKIVATGITFETNKATLKPESMGVINKIYRIMEKHPELKFSVEGHTDNVGDEDFNMKLSLARAETVRNKLISMGIASDRLTVKGLGETTPVADNSSPEGRANNRRVEFVKI